MLQRPHRRARQAAAVSPDLGAACREARNRWQREYRRRVRDRLMIVPAAISGAVWTCSSRSWRRGSRARVSFGPFG
jgi:hypothetical protein